MEMPWEMQNAQNVKLRKLTVRVTPLKPHFCEACDQYYCNESALQQHNNSYHFVMKTPEKTKNEIPPHIPVLDESEESKNNFLAAGDEFSDSGIDYQQNLHNPVFYESEKLEKKVLKACNDFSNIDVDQQQNLHNTGMEKLEKSDFEISNNDFSNNDPQEMHDNEMRDHKCDKCDKMFKKFQHLKKHIKTVHEGVKEHKCSTCGKMFKQIGHLRTHIRNVHEGIKDQECKLCGKMFKMRGHLKAHMKSVHKIENLNEFEQQQAQSQTNNIANNSDLKSNMNNAHVNNAHVNNAHVNNAHVNNAHVNNAYPFRECNFQSVPVQENMKYVQGTNTTTQGVQGIQYNTGGENVNQYNENRSQAIPHWNHPAPQMNGAWGEVRRTEHVFSYERKPIEARYFMNNVENNDGVTDFDISAKHYKCDLCENVFLTVQSLNNHFDIIHLQD